MQSEATCEPQVQWRFTVYYEPDSSRPLEEGKACIRDFELFSSIARLLGDHSPHHIPSQPCSAACREYADSTRLSQTLNLLAGIGLHPVFSTRRSNERSPREFKVQRVFPPATTEELDAAPFLCKDLCMEGGWGTHLDGDTLHARWEEEIGHPEAPIVDVRGKVRDYPTAWTLEAQRWLWETDMRGGNFAPIIWDCDDPRVRAHSHYLRSSVNFPHSLTPRCVGSVLVDDAYLATFGEPDSFEWDDDGRSLGDVRMFYHRSDIERMRGTDIARTFESFPTGGEFGRRMPAKMIFSQRFRRWTDDRGLGFRWQPIVVVD